MSTSVKVAKKVTTRVGGRTFSGAVPENMLPKSLLSEEPAEKSAGDKGKK